MIGLFATWVLFILIVYLSAGPSPKKHRVWSRKSSVFLWFWGLVAVAGIYMLLAAIQLSVGCRAFGECYSSDLPAGYLPIKMLLGVTTYGWWVLATIYAAIGLVMRLFTYRRNKKNDLEY